MQRPDNELQIRIKEYEIPTFGYRRGENGEIEKDIFDGEVPDGWVDSPAKVDLPYTPIKGLELPQEAQRQVVEVQPAITLTKPALPTLDDGPGPFDSKIGEDRIVPPYKDHRFNALKAELKRRTGKGAPSGTNKVAVIEMLEELDAVEREDPSWRHAENR